MADDPKSDAMAVAAITTTMIQGALIARLILKGILTVDEVREIYDQALLTLETEQALADLQHQVVYEAARKHLQKFLEQK